MTQTYMPKFKIGDRVCDVDGYRGTVVKVTEWRGSTWYDVRFWDGDRCSGVAVRYDQDLGCDLESAK